MQDHRNFCIIYRHCCCCKAYFSSLQSLNGILTTSSGCIMCGTQREPHHESNGPIWMPKRVNWLPTVRSVSQQLQFKPQCYFTVRVGAASGPGPRGWSKGDPEYTPTTCPTVTVLRQWWINTSLDLELTIYAHLRLCSAYPLNVDSIVSSFYNIPQYVEHWTRNITMGHLSSEWNIDHELRSLNLAPFT